LISLPHGCQNRVSLKIKRVDLIEEQDKSTSVQLSGASGLVSISGGVYSAATILCLYVSISFLDLWAFVPSWIQAIFYLAAILGCAGFIMLGVSGRINKAGTLLKSGFCLSALAASVILFVNYQDFSRLSELAVKPRALFDYPSAEIKITVTAPLYLKEDTVTIDFKKPDEIKTALNPIYEGSVLDVHVKGIKWAPKIELSDGAIISFEEMPDGSFKASAKIDNQNFWSLKQGAFTIASWPIDLIDDPAPVINQFALEDYKNNKGYLALKVEVKDDRKIMKTSVGLIDAAGVQSDIKNLKASKIEAYKNIFYLDFTSSDHAGETLDLVLSVEDEAGQISTAVIHKVQIPEKFYKNEIASKLISLHRELAKPDYELNSIARQIRALGLLTENEFLPPVYYMAMQSAYRRLSDPVYPTDREMARNLLWDIAQKLEDSELGPIENSLLDSLDHLKLSINQKKEVLDIRENLREVDKLFQDYVYATYTTTSANYPLDIDIGALRKLYSYILTFSDQGKYYNAALIVDFMRKGLVQNDDLIFGKGGLGNYFALSESQKIIDNLIAIQKTLLASSFNDQMRVKLASTMREKSGLDLRNNSQEKKISQKHSQILLQTKVGNAVKLLGEKISFTGDSSDYLIQNASELVEEILAGMKKSEINQVTQDQTELITVMSNLKRVLNRPILQSPELQNIMKEITSAPVL